jgi:Dolichyl-phosphate-mannose-protein mannosyltransferase
MAQPHPSTAAPAGLPKATAPHFARALEALFLLLVPLLSFYAVHFGGIQQNRMLDPYIYTGYIYNFHDLWARYGMTYYGVRFGLILPARLFTAVFGVEGGYFVLRYLLALVFGIPLYAVIKRHLSAPVAVLTYVIALTSPYLARALLWDHPDAAGVPFLTAAICLMMLNAEDSKTAFAAGCCFGMAGNSNVFTIAPFGVFLASMAITELWFGKPLGRFCTRVAIAAAGALSVCAAGALYYRIATGYLDIFAVTLLVAKSLSQGGMEQWRTTGTQWTFSLFHVYVPVWLSICALLGYRQWKRSLPAATMACFVVALTAFYYVHQFLLHANTLQLFYYFSYAAPAIFLGFAVIFQRIYEAVHARPAWFVGAGACCAIVPWILYSFGRAPLLLPTTPLFAGTSSIFPSIPRAAALASPGMIRFALAASCATVAWVGLLYWRPKSVNIAFAAVALFSFAWVFGFATYGGAIEPRAGRDTSEIDVYHTAHALMDAVPQFNGSNGILFWYTNRPQNSIDSLQSTYLWEFSRWHKSGSQQIGLPYVDNKLLARLNDPQIRYLGVICESREELRLGLNALTAQGLAYTEAAAREIGSGSYHAFWALLDLRPGAGHVANREN